MSVTLDLDLADELRGAQDRGEIVLHFQPEIDLASGGVVGMEALMRWAHPRRGLLPPSAFLEVAHKAGLLLPLSTWVLEQCAAERARWESLPPHPTVGLCQLWVNVPAVQLAAAGFVDEVRELIERHHLPPRSLGLEFSESTLGDVGAAAAALLIGLREAGCALAVDDFGTWYSSLARFEEMPVDAVKLDRRFVRGLGVDLDDDSIVASRTRASSTSSRRASSHGPRARASVNSAATAPMGSCSADHRKRPVPVRCSPAEAAGPRPPRRRSPAPPHQRSRRAGHCRSSLPGHERGRRF